MKGATGKTLDILAIDFVSIHAPNEGSDLCEMQLQGWYDRFNPRSQ